MTEKTLPTYEVRAVGYVRRSAEGINLEILEQFRPALANLSHFSHVIVLWWADRHDNAKSRSALQTRPPYARDQVMGIFATRAEYRPNPIGLTTCRLLAVDEANGSVRVADIDALDGTPVLDLKAYFPVCDRVRKAHIPVWLSDWPKWLPDDGLGL
jgi:tRNA-Thr(GGU) m(6)t(6)A37 methyltransferase TsaA